MEEIMIPTVEEISTMSASHCQQERLRLKNEISFARGDETTGGPSNRDKIAAFKVALELIDERMETLTNRVAAWTAANMKMGRGGPERGIIMKIELKTTAKLLAIGALFTMIGTGCKERVKETTTTTETTAPAPAADAPADPGVPNPPVKPDVSDKSTDSTTTSTRSDSAPGGDATTTEKSRTHTETSNWLAGLRPFAWISPTIGSGTFRNSESDGLAITYLNEWVPPQYEQGGGFKQRWRSSRWRTLQKITMWIASLL
jgi:hypothetical protein